MNLNDPIEILLRVSTALSSQNLSYVLHGGLAIAVYGEARETRDVDCVVLGPDLNQIIVAINAVFPITKLAFLNQDFKGILCSRITLLEGEDHNVIDLITMRVDDYLHRLMERKAVTELRGQEIHLISIEDLIILKTWSSRPIDMHDIVNTYAINKNEIDLDLIQTEIDYLQQAVPKSDILTKWSKIMVYLN